MCRIHLVPSLPKAALIDIDEQHNWKSSSKLRILIWPRLLSLLHHHNFHPSSPPHVTSRQSNTRQTAFPHSHWRATSTSGALSLVRHHWEIFTTARESVVAAVSAIFFLKCLPILPGIQQIYIGETNLLYCVNFTFCLLISKHLCFGIIVQSSLFSKLIAD